MYRRCIAAMLFLLLCGRPAEASFSEKASALGDALSSLPAILSSAYMSCKEFFASRFLKENQADVVAEVNGHAITLRQLESLYDMHDCGIVLAQNPSVELLQEQYGSALLTLIVQELIFQELAKRDIAISEEEIQAEEASVRGDYPVGDFEKALEEDYLDLHAWREMLRNQIALRLFRQKVLRANLNISREEILAAYAEQQEILNKPEKIEFFWFEDSDRERLEKKYSAVQADASILNESEAVRINPAHLPENIQKILAALKPGQISRIHQEGSMAVFLVLQKRIPEHKPDIVEAYPVLEEIVAGRRIMPVYETWLQKTLAKADIRVAAGLQPGIHHEKQNPQTIQKDVDTKDSGEEDGQD